MNFPETIPFCFWTKNPGIFAQMDRKQALQRYKKNKIETPENITVFEVQSNEITGGVIARILGALSKDDVSIRQLWYD